MIFSTKFLNNDDEEAINIALSDDISMNSTNSVSFMKQNQLMIATDRGAV